MGNPTVYTDLLLNDAKAKQGLQSLKGDFSNWATSIDRIFKRTAIGMVAALGAAFAGAGIGAWMTADLAANAQEITNKFNVVFSDLKDEAKSFADDLSDYLGQSLAKTQKAMGGFGDLFKPLGMAQGEALQLSHDIVKLTGDIASFNDTNFDDVMRDVTSALIGGHEAVAKYGIILNEMSLKAEGAGIKATGLEKTMARARIMFKMSGDATNDIARNLGSLTDVTNRFWKAWEETLIEVGKLFVPIKIGIVAIGQAIMEKFGKGASLINDTLLPAAKQLGDLLERIAVKIKETSWDTWKGDLENFLKEMKAISIGVMTALGNMLQIIMVEAAKVFGDAMMIVIREIGLELAEAITNPWGYGAKALMAGGAPTFQRGEQGQLQIKAWGEESTDEFSMQDRLQMEARVITELLRSAMQAAKDEEPKKAPTTRYTRQPLDPKSPFQPYIENPFGTGLPEDPFASSLKNWNKGSNSLRALVGGNLSIPGAEEMGREAPTISGVAETYNRMFSDFIAKDKPEEDTAKNTTELVKAAGRAEIQRKNQITALENIQKAYEGVEMGFKK